MRKTAYLLVLVTAVAASGCADMTDSQRRVTTGGGVGAASGALIGSFSGNAGAGALIGAGVGMAGGYLYDQSKKNEQSAYQQGYSAGKRGY
jgi:uncharacterized membrane protein